MANELMLECLRAREEIVFHAAADLIERLERELSDANERHIKEMETRNLTLDAATMGLFEAKKLHAVTMRERDEARAALAGYVLPAEMIRRYDEAVDDVVGSAALARLAEESIGRWFMQTFRLPNPGSLLLAKMAAAERLREACEIAPNRMAHPHKCVAMNPVDRWAELGSRNYINCICGIKKIRDAIDAYDKANK